MKPIWAILIDPYVGSVSWTKIEPRLENYRILLDCHRVDLIRLPNGEGIYIDDEALLNLDETTRFWMLPGFAYPLAAAYWSGPSTGLAMIAALPLTQQTCGR